MTAGRCSRARKRSGGAGQQGGGEGSRTRGSVRDSLLRDAGERKRGVPGQGGVRYGRGISVPGRTDGGEGERALAAGGDSSAQRQGFPVPARALYFSSSVQPDRASSSAFAKITLSSSVQPDRVSSSAFTQRARRATSSASRAAWKLCSIGRTSRETWWSTGDKWPSEAGDARYGFNSAVQAKGTERDSRRRDSGPSQGRLRHNDGG